MRFPSPVTRLEPRGDPFQKALHDRLRVMDVSAFDMCSEAKLPVLVFNYRADRAIERAVAGHPIGTLITAE